MSCENNKVLEQLRTNSKDSFYNLASELIGGNVTPEKVKGVVDFLNEGRHIVHGIKDYGKLKDIDRKGVLPLTPEGGM